MHCKPRVFYNFMIYMGNVNPYMSIHKLTNLCPCMSLSFAAESILSLSKQVRELG